ncbi:nodulation protein NfeD [Achromobacter sp. NPDC058515]|uniref:NfeD family protein n=1 Tax=Achromobacter sp. NPDC058515 TaxID=3346533 RepID=UPI003660BD5E
MVILRLQSRTTGPRSTLRTVCVIALLWALAIVNAWGETARDASPQRSAVVLSLDGIVGPATADYLIRGLAAAREQNAALVVLRIDTPGGLDTSMRDIIRAILASPVPVISYVSPNGSRAASAGTYILYASHIAAMAPATNLGAATPISIGGGFPRPADKEPGPTDKPGDKQAPERADGNPRTAAPKDASEAKAINDAVAYIRSLAALRGRNADWAEQAVRSAASLSAGEARAQKVIDLIADDIPDLLDQVDGRTVRVGNSETVLHSKGLRLDHREPDWRTRALSVITNPNLALLLLMVGVYGLIFEFMSPGSLYPGVIGSICLLVGLYALSALPLTYAGLALALLGAVLMVAEIFTPSVGILGIGGAISFVLGSLLLIDTDSPAFEVSLPFIAGVAIVSLGMTFLIGRLALRSRRAPIVSGAEALIGQRIRVLSWQGEQGHVSAAGERWRAVGPTGLAPGDTVVIAAVQGVTLHVRADTSPPAPAAPPRR